MADFRCKFWEDFAASVQYLNEYIKPRVLRRYQSELLNGRKLEVTSPFSGDRVRLSRSIRFGGHIAYQFHDGEPFWLATGAFQHGHPLTEFISGQIAQGRSSIAIDRRSPAGLSANSLERFRRIAGEHTNASPHTCPTLIVGHPNFAHHLWNELSGLDEWVRNASPQAIAALTIIPVAEPLGPLCAIFPQLATASSRRDDPRFPGETESSAPLFVRVGSRRVTTRVRQILHRFSERHANAAAVDPVVAVLAAGWPRIWISVRQKSRTAENQLEFLLAIIRKTFLVYPKAAVVFDGFSFPIGFFEDVRTIKHRPEFASRATAAAKFINLLRDKVAREHGSAVASRLSSICGLSIADAICVGSRCNYYICHAGTLQHKIAWLHNLPGFIHSPPQALAQSHALWHANQVEDGIVPDMLSESLASSTSSSSKPNATRNFNYIITDVERAADNIVTLMQLRLEPS